MHITKAELEDIISRAVEEQEEHIIQHVQESFSGPLPHPQHLKEYKQIDKTYPSIIISMAKSRQAHVEWLQKFESIGDLFMSFLGWLTPSGISFFSLYKAAEFVALIVALGSIGTAFYVYKKTSKEQDSKIDD